MDFPKVFEEELSSQGVELTRTETPDYVVDVAKYDMNDYAFRLPFGIKFGYVAVK